MKLRISIIYTLFFYFFANFSNAQESGCVEGTCINGWGKYLFSNGDYYIGNWKNKTYNGFGYESFTNGTIRIGFYNNDHCLRGYYIDYIGKDGIYFGEFVKENKFEGYGLRIPSTKDFILEGYPFVNGKFSNDNEFSMKRNSSQATELYNNLILESENLKKLIDNNSFNSFKCLDIDTPLDLTLTEKINSSNTKDVVINSNTNYTLTKKVDVKVTTGEDLGLYNIVIPFKNGFIIPISPKANYQSGLVLFDQSFSEFELINPKFTTFDNLDRPANVDWVEKQESIPMYEISSKNLNQINNNLFNTNGIFIDNNSIAAPQISNSLLFIDFSYCYNFDIKPICKLIDKKGRNQQFEVKKNDKIYTFIYDKIIYTGNSEDKYFIRTSKSSTLHNGAKVLTIERVNFEDESSYGISAISIDNIIENYTSAQKTKSYYYTNDLKYVNLNWNINQVFLLKNKKIAVIIDLTESYERTDSRFNFPIPQDFKKSLVLIFDEYGKEIINYTKVVTAEQYFPSDDGNFYAIVSDGIIIFKYNTNGDILWKNGVGFSKEKNVENDALTCWTQNKDKLFLGGVTKSKYHIGKKDPILFEINSQTGQIEEEKVHKSEESDSETKGIFTCNNQTYYIVKKTIYKF